MTQETDSAAPPAKASPKAATLPGERGISPIAGRFELGRGGKAATVAAIAAGCGVFMFATARHPPAKAAQPQAPARQVVAFEPAAAPTLAHPGADAPSLSGIPAIDPTASAPATAAARPPARAEAEGPLLALTRNTAPMTPTAAAPQSADPDRSGPLAGVGVARASRLPDRNFLLLAGASIPCVLQTAMDTATPGYVSCLAPTDVYSDNGAVVLLEKGTRVLGEYRGGLKQGQGRLFIVWTRAVTPGGVAIALASPATDALGRAGLDGDVDTHFWSRFGGAILLSVIDGGFSAAARAAPAVTLSGPASAATAALQGSIGIAPTLRKAPGAEVAILAAQDLDFSGVYGVKPR